MVSRKAYVLPHLEYCSPLLLGVGNAETTKIETTNYFILRTILGFSKSVSYDFLLKLADIKSLENRRQFQSLGMRYPLESENLKILFHSSVLFKPTWLSGSDCKYRYC